MTLAMSSSGKHRWIDDFTEPATIGGGVQPARAYKKLVWSVIFYTLRVESIFGTLAVANDHRVRLISIGLKSGLYGGR